MSDKFPSNVERQAHLLDLMCHGCFEDAALKFYEWTKTGVFSKKDFDEALDNFRCFKR